MSNMFRCTLASGGALILTVTCDSAFAGQTITCTDGTTTLTQICPSTSPYTVEFKIPNGGTWTISSGTASTSVVIPDSIELHDIPNGSTITPINDIQIWLHCANIWDKSYTTITQVLNDASTLQTLIASNNAADYMARSTSWASGVTADSSAMTYIGLNDYCSNKLLEDSSWRNAICNSTHFESVLNYKIPTMTSATSPSGVVSASSNASGYYPYRIYDGDNNTVWLASPESTNNYNEYAFQDPIKPIKVEMIMKWYISTGQSVSARQAIIQGSNDESNWDDLISISIPQKTSNATETYTEVMSPTNFYKSIRVFMAENMQATNKWSVQIATLQIYGRSSL